MSMTSLVRTGFCASLIALFLTSPAIFAAPLPVDDTLARSILEKSDAIRFPSQDFQVDVDIASASPGEATEKRKYRILSKGSDNTVVMILEPASERGQIMLMKGRDLWVQVHVRLGNRKLDALVGADGPVKHDALTGVASTGFRE